MMTMKVMHNRSLVRRGSLLLVLGALIAAALSTISPAQAQTPASTTTTTTIAPVEEETTVLYSHDESKDIGPGTSGASNFKGLWGKSDGDEQYSDPWDLLYAVDPFADKVFAFAVADGEASFGTYLDDWTLNISASANAGHGIWSDGTTLLVADAGRQVHPPVDPKIVTLSLSNGGDVSDTDLGSSFDLPEANANPQGIWSDGTTLWVVDSGDTYVYAYTLATGVRDRAKGFDLQQRLNLYPSGLWSDGTTIWVIEDTSLDGESDRALAYTLADGSRDAKNDFDLHSNNGAATGAWSDGTTMWVADSDDNKFYAYHMTGEREGGL